jgi:hypothetical protein
MAMPRKLLARHVGQIGRFNARNLPLSKEMAKHADFGVMLRFWPARPQPLASGILRLRSFLCYPLFKRTVV